MKSLTYVVYAPVPNDHQCTSLEMFCAERVIAKIRINLQNKDVL